MKKTKQLRNLWYRLSSKQRFIIRRLYYLPNDLFDTIKGKTHKYVPPRGLIYTGGPQNAKLFLEQGKHQLRLLKKEVILTPSDKVLDIGSGIGRTAIALTSYLNKNGSYNGFDVVKTGVDWCIKKISKDYTNFKFKYVPLFNDLYNTSQLKATDFVFPYNDDTFNKVFSFSLFTHMQINEIQHYFHEIERVLKSDGLCFSTFFLYNSNTEEYISKRENFNFPFKKENYRLMSNDVKSANIALDEEKLSLMLRKAKLKIVRIIDGYWKDKIRDINKKEYQDIVIFRKV